MAHVSGNPTWQDFPSTQTPVSAHALENIEKVLDITPDITGARDEAIAARDAAVDAATRAEDVGDTNDTIMTGVLRDPDSTFGGELSATFVASRGTELRAAQAAIARQDVDILVIGDSISEGTGPTRIENRFASRLRDSLRASLGLPAGGRGYVPAMYAVNPPAPDELWALSGGASDFILGRGLGKRAVRLNASGHKATLTVPAGHTDVSLLITCDSSMTSWFTPTIDGVPGSNVNVQALASSTLRDVVVPVATGLNPNASHTIEIAWVVGNVYLSGAMLYAAGEKAGGPGSGVRLWDGSHHGKGSEWFTNASEPWNHTINTIQPDLVIIALGRNNWSGGSRTPAQVASDIEALIGNIKSRVTVEPTFIIMPVYGNKASGTPVAAWSEYVTAQRGVASVGGYGFLDLSARLGTITNAATNALGILTADYVHPSDIGAQMIADELAGYLAPAQRPSENDGNTDPTFNVVTMTEGVVDGAPGTPRAVTFRSNDSYRWIFRANGTAETGSDVGSDFELLSRTDAGGVKMQIFRIYRSNGRIELGNGVDFALGTGAGNKIGINASGKLGFYGATPTARPSGVAVTVEAIHAALVTLGLIEP